jgi:hypothetical protein
MVFTQAPAPPNGNSPMAGISRWQLRRAKVTLAARRMGSRAAKTGAKVAAWRWTPALPGIAGVLLVSTAAGGLVGQQAGFMYGIWAGAGCLGLFLLRIDRRLS